MPKIKRFEAQCNYAICPLGKGIPMCMYNIVKEHRLGEVKINDIPFCPGLKKCPFKSKEVQV